MLLSTNGINIDALPIKEEKIRPKSLKEYEREIGDVIKKVKENAKKGIAIFTDSHMEVKQERP